jgi:hypothetical protein
MKVFRSLLCITLIALPRLALGQMNHPAPAPTDAQKIFAGLKSLSGTWVGAIQTFPKMPTASIGDSMRITMRVLSRGNTLVHEMHGASMPEDADKYDHPITVVYLNDDGKLTLTHYCDAGNRPRMTARVSADGKVIDFDFVDISGRHDRTGHMQHATFTLIDADRHVQEWTYLLPNKQTVRARFEVRREEGATAGAAKQGI